MDVASVCVVGACGFAGIELCRLVLGHPGMELRMATDRKAAGTRLADVRPAFEGATESQAPAPSRFSPSPTPRRFRSRLACWSLA